ncbi:MAG: phage shock protein A [Rhodothermales bacterium]|jgi:phage shock protein A
MGIFKSVYRYIVTLGGLIGGDIDSQTDDMLSTPSAIKTTYDKTRERWATQYSEVRGAVAQLMTVLEQKNRAVQDLQAEAKAVKVKMDGAVLRFQETNDAKYQEAFNTLFQRDKQLAAEQENLSKEIDGLHGKVEGYKKKLQEMDSRIKELKKQESAAIADIVSSKQVIALNDRLNNISTDLDDRNLSAIEERRANLVAQAKLSGELNSTLEEPNLEDELLKAGETTEASAVFAAMLSEAQGAESATPEQRVQENGSSDRSL